MPLTCQYSLSVNSGQLGVIPKCEAWQVGKSGAGSHSAKSRPEQERRSRNNANNASIMLIVRVLFLVLVLTFLQLKSEASTDIAKLVKV